MSIAKAIKRYRLSQGLTQLDLAIKINKTVRSIQRYEKGDILPPIDVISEIAKVLRVTTSDLIDAEIDTSMGEKVRQARECKHLSQTELAKKLGISHVYMRMIESNQRTGPSYLIKAKLNEILGTEIYDIGSSIQLLQLSSIPTKDLIEELNKRNDWRMTT